MSGAKNGGPAFPVTDLVAFAPLTIDEERRAATGMSLRDYFAAKAMQTIFCPGGPLNEWPKWAETQNLAGRAYEIADAMLKAREVQS